MLRRTLLYIVLFVPIVVFGQNTIPDTISAENAYLKKTGDYIIETTQEIAYTIVINEFMARNSGSFFDNAGDDDDWFEIYNYGDDSINIAELWFTDNQTIPFKWRITNPESIYLQPKQHMIFWADEETEEGYNHTSFKLNGDGEYLAIHDSNTILIDEISYAAQTPNVSYGRTPDGGEIWNFFSQPSPDKENNETGSLGVLTQPSFSHKGGFYLSPFELELYTDDGIEIRYTLDCSEPQANSPQYTEPIFIDGSTIIRAKAMKYGNIDSPTLSLSFFIEPNNYDNPVISIVSDSANLFGTDGITDSNITRTEISANFEYFVNDRTVFNSGTGIQVHANGSGSPNSLRLYARSRYGNSWFNYPFFNQEGAFAHKRLVLRNSGNDNVNNSSTRTHLRDPLAHKIAKASNKNALISDSKLVNVYFNGKYYGLYNLRERQDEYYIETHSSESENIDLIERAFGYPMNRNVIEGSLHDWLDLLSFADTTGDLTLDSDFQLIEDNVDLDNFTDYWITEVFLGNYDWLSNNIKFWKPENGKWQWMYWDLDHGLGLPYMNYGKASWNTLNWSLGFADRAWNNGYNNILIRSLLENQSYKEFFIERFTYLLNTGLSYDFTKTLLEDMITTYENDMSFHAERWNNNINDWISACGTIDNYLKNRPAYVFNHLQEYFELDDPVPVSINVQPIGAGSLYFGSTEINKASYSGSHFPGTYELNAEPIPGYVLYHIYINNKAYQEHNFELSDSTKITAIFQPDNGLIPIEFTEVFFNNRNEYDCGDWIELYYYGNDILDLSGCSLVDQNNDLLYSFEEGEIMVPRTYLVITENHEMFKDVFTGEINCLGNLSSGFSDRLNFKLLSKQGELLSEIDLGESPNLLSFPDEGFSYALFNREEGQYWEISPDKFGSPGIQNNTSYHFHPPNGKDTIISNLSPIAIRFDSSLDFFSDDDKHKLTKIHVTSINGPGHISSEGVTIQNNTYYKAADFYFDPRNSFDSDTKLSYRLIDRSGEASSGNTIIFQSTTDIHPNQNNTIRLYPSPAQDICYIEIDGEPMDNFHFTLIDVRGKIIHKFDESENTIKTAIDLSEVEAGLYFYLISSKSRVFNGKIVVIK